VYLKVATVYLKVATRGWKKGHTKGERLPQSALSFQAALDFALRIAGGLFAILNLKPQSR